MRAWPPKAATTIKSAERSRRIAQDIRDRFEKVGAPEFGGDFRSVARRIIKCADTAIEEANAGNLDDAAKWAAYARQDIYKLPRSWEHPERAKWFLSHLWSTHHADESPNYAAIAARETEFYEQALENWEADANA